MGAWVHGMIRRSAGRLAGGLAGWMDDAPVGALMSRWMRPGVEMDAPGCRVWFDAPVGALVSVFGVRQRSRALLFVLSCLIVTPTF